MIHVHSALDSFSSAMTHWHGEILRDRSEKWPENTCFFLYMSKVPRLKCWIMRCIKVGVNPSQKTMLNSSTEEPSMAQLLMPNHLFSFHFKGFKQRGIHEFKSKRGMDQVYQAIQFFADAGISTWRFVTFFSCHLLAFSFPLLFLQVTFSTLVF